MYNTPLPFVCNIVHNNHALLTGCVHILYQSFLLCLPLLVRLIFLVENTYTYLILPISIKFRCCFISTYKMFSVIVEWYAETIFFIYTYIRIIGKFFFNM